MRYRWAVLGAGTAAQASFSAITLGLPAIAPALRDEYELGLLGVGVLLAAEWVGLTLALLPWGLLSDRIGERWALAGGLAGCGLLIAAMSQVSSFGAALVLLGCAGAAGASVQSGSGRAVMRWFAPGERGLAFGIRQTSVLVGGVVGALVLPPLADAGGVEAALLFLAALCISSAVAGAIVFRSDPGETIEVEAVPWTLRDRRLWLLCGASGFYVATQIVVFGFLVLFLHDVRGLSTAGAALVLAVGQVVGVGCRIGAGVWSDSVGSRVMPLRWIGLATVLSLGTATVLLDVPLGVLLPVLVLVIALSAAWNGLSFAAAAELAGPARSGAAIGFQQTVLSVAGVAVPPFFAAVVDVTSWRLGFGLAAVAPLIGWALLRPLVGR